MKLWILILLIYTIELYSQEAIDRAVRIDVEYNTEINGISLKWNQDTSSLRNIISRKAEGEELFDELIRLEEYNDTSFTDITIKKGISYDYMIENYRKDFSAYGYINCGIEIPLDSSRKKILLLVDDTIYDSLKNEINHFRELIFSEGYSSKLVKVPRVENFDSKEVENIKEVIRKEYNSELPITDLLLIGRVAIPYSGFFAIDGHENHIGAWPADIYYAEFDSIWTDTLTPEKQFTDFERQINVANDGKYDQNIIPDKVDIAVGRVDFYDLPYFKETEIDLYKRYFSKNVAFRRSQIAIPEVAIIDGRWGTNNEAFTSHGWYGFAALLGSENVSSGRMRELIRENSYLWAFGAAAGSFDSAEDVAYSEEYAKYNVNAVFGVYLGSYFADWDSRNNLLRSAIASSPTMLTAVFSGRPAWHFHHMGMGKTIGYSTKFTQNLFGNEYIASDLYGHRGMHIALMGDPSLKMRYYPPIDSIQAVKLENDEYQISWSEAKDNDILGYNLYYTSNLDREITKLNTEPIQGNTYSIGKLNFGISYYSVRALRLRNSVSGSYYDESPGAIIKLERPFNNEILEEKNLMVFPNPASDFLNIIYNSEIENYIELNVYDLNGRMVENIYKGNASSGINHFVWDLLNSQNQLVSKGKYLIVISNSDLKISEELIIIK